jgi:8-oxo-dGTP pyrophosphatase MutT (NUDIX family)
MGVSVKGHRLHIELTIPLPYKYRGGGVAVFRINNGQPEVLLGLRANNPGRGRWSFPGGGAEGKEKLSTAAFREFREETGVQILGRYITKTGLFSIKNYFFEWNTIIIESTQAISVSKYFSKDRKKEVDLIGGEFTVLRWMAVSELSNYKLHRWVKDVIDFYMNGKMKPYTAMPPKDSIRILPNPKSENRSKYTRRKSGADLLFDISEMTLTNVGYDGTKYFQPKYQVSGRKSSMFQEALYGVL